MSINGINRALSLLNDLASEPASRPLAPTPLTPPQPNYDGAATRLGEQSFAASMMTYKIKSQFAAQQSAKPQPTLETYRTQAAATLGTAAKSDALTRNRAISGAYAALYVKNPEAFRWVGAAAHASSQVGLAMEGTRATAAIRDALGRNDKAGLDAAINKMIAIYPHAVSDKLTEVAKANPRQSLGLINEIQRASPDADFSLMSIAEAAFGSKVAMMLVMTEATGKRAGEFEQMLGDGNKAIYENIYPAALAYQQGGLAELKRLEATMPDDSPDKPLFTPLVAAFEDIDKGIKLKACGETAAGEALIREGNEKLINHEQRAIAQPVVFDKHPDLAFLMSPLAFGDFDADTSKIDAQTASYFWFKTEKTLRPAGGSVGTAILGERAGVGAVTKFEEVERNVPTNFMRSIADANARIDWITKDIFVKWYDLTAKQPTQVRTGMSRIMEVGRQVGGNY